MQADTWMLLCSLQPNRAECCAVWFITVRRHTKNLGTQARPASQPDELANKLASFKIELPRAGGLAGWGRLGRLPPPAAGCQCARGPHTQQAIAHQCAAATGPWQLFWLPRLGRPAAETGTQAGHLSTPQSFVCRLPGTPRRRNETVKSHLPAQQAVLHAHGMARHGG